MPACTVVVGRLWALTVVVTSWMQGETAAAWWGAGSLCLPFLVALAIRWVDPKTADRAGRAGQTAVRASRVGQETAAGGAGLGRAPEPVPPGRVGGRRAGRTLEG